jgi:transcriptional regulator of heat shock response
MATLRTKSVSTKVTEEEYARFEALAGERTISEWARDVLSRAANPKTCEQTILAEVLALRAALLNLFFKLASAERITADGMQQLIERADADKLKKALSKIQETEKLLIEGGTK